MRPSVVKVPFSWDKWGFGSTWGVRWRGMDTGCMMNTGEMGYKALLEVEVERLSTSI